MLDLSLGSTVLVVVAAAFTAVAAACDLSTKRIPNALTLPVFAAGWIYQVVDRGWVGLGDAGAGFLLGFGLLFVLWMIGGGGGGDVKLMGALSVWLGFRLTLLVLVASTILVILCTVVAMAWSAITRGTRETQQTHLPPKPRPDGAVRESVSARQRRRILPYAVPVALATWLVIGWKLPTLDNPVRGKAASASQSVPADHN
jgi:prepilin peptidase CpaA